VFHHIDGEYSFNIYVTVLFTWLAIIFKEDLLQLINKVVGNKFDFIDALIDKLKPLESAIEILLAILVATLVAYAAFLLSALKPFRYLTIRYYPC